MKERQLGPSVHQEERKHPGLGRQHHIWNEVESYRVLRTTTNSLVFFISTAVIDIPLLSNVRVIRCSLIGVE